MAANGGISPVEYGRQLRFLLQKALPKFFLCVLVIATFLTFAPSIMRRNAELMSSLGRDNSHVQRLNQAMQRHSDSAPSGGRSAIQQTSAGQKTARLRKGRNQSNHRNLSMANGASCPAVYGTVIVLVAVVTESYQNFYHVAQSTLQCYLKSSKYTLKLVDLKTDERVAKSCHHDQLFFRKHCAASVYLEDADWMLVLDADTGVVNPGHCIEEYIDNSVDLIFYERFFNWEVASGNYLVKNTPFAKRFLRRWADYQFEQPSNWNGADNGVLQILLLKTLLPDATPEIRTCEKIWLKGTGYETYMRYVICCKVALGARRIWPGQIKIFRRGHGWVRDGFLTGDKFCQNDFMLHGWKANQTGLNGWQSPFKHVLNISECGEGVGEGWPYRENYRTSTTAIKSSLSHFEQSAAKNFPKEARTLSFLEEADVGECWPECEH